MILKKFLSLIFIGFTLSSTYSQQYFFTETEIFAQFKNKDAYTYLGQTSWYRAKCLYNKDEICKNGSHGGLRIKFSSYNDNAVKEEILISNGSGYKRPNFDKLTYLIHPNTTKQTYTIRELFFEEKYKIDSSFVVDTLDLHLTDQINFGNRRLIKRVFKNKEIDSLKIYVYSESSSGTSGSLHFWVEHIGIIKVVYKDCWRYSFELNLRGRVAKRQLKLFDEILSAIRQKYPDPYWYDAPCNISWN